MDSYNERLQKLQTEFEQMVDSIPSQEIGENGYKRGTLTAYKNAISELACINSEYSEDSNKEVRDYFDFLKRNRGESEHNRHSIVGTPLLENQYFGQEDAYTRLMSMVKAAFPDLITEHIPAYSTVDQQKIKMGPQGKIFNMFMIKI